MPSNYEHVPTCARFYCFQRAPGRSIKGTDAYWKGPQHEKNLTLVHVNNKEQACIRIHQRLYCSLMESIITELASCKISQTSLSLTLSDTRKTGFLERWPHCILCDPVKCGSRGGGGPDPPPPPPPPPENHKLYGFL